MDQQQAPDSFFDSALSQAAARQTPAEPQVQPRTPAGVPDMGALMPNMSGNPVTALQQDFPGMGNVTETPVSPLAQFESTFQEPVAAPVTPATDPAAPKFDAMTGKPLQPAAPAPAPAGQAYYQKEDFGDKLTTDLKLFDGVDTKTVAATLAEELKNTPLLGVNEISAADQATMAGGDFTPLVGILQQLQYRTMVEATTRIVGQVSKELGTKLPTMFKNFGQLSEGAAVNQQLKGVGGNTVHQSIALDYATKYRTQNPGASVADVKTNTEAYMKALAKSFAAPQTNQPAGGDAGVDWSTF